MKTLLDYALAIGSVLVVLALCFWVLVEAFVDGLYDEQS